MASYFLSPPQDALHLSPLSDVMHHQPHHAVIQGFVTRHHEMGECLVIMLSMSEHVILSHGCHVVNFPSEAQNPGGMFKESIRKLDAVKY